MHSGNLSFLVAQDGSLDLAPVYDMLPMMYAPTAANALPDRAMGAPTPRAEMLDVWSEMVQLAVACWTTISTHDLVSIDFAALARRNAQTVRSLPICRPMSMDNLLLTAIGLLLVLLNGFFVAAEFAIVKLRRTQAEELARTHGLRGRVLRTVRTHLDAYLSACQLGITLASLGLGWIGEPAFARLIEPVLAFANITDPKVVHSIAFAFAFALISFLHIVVGELAPKSLAIRRAETVSLNTALPLYVFYWVMYPFIHLLNGAANILLRGLGVELASEGDEAHSVDELRTVLRASHRHGELGAIETQILTRGLDLGDLVVGDVMRPLAELVWIGLDTSIDDVLTEVRTSRYTRYPVRDPETQRFVGLLHIKELLTAIRAPAGHSRPAPVPAYAAPCR